MTDIQNFYRLYKTMQTSRVTISVWPNITEALARWAKGRASAQGGTEYFEG